MGEVDNTLALVFFATRAHRCCDLSLYVEQASCAPERSSDIVPQALQNHEVLVSGSLQLRLKEKLWAHFE